MSVLVIKSLHLISIVTWFAGLFYIVRLFIYHVEALEREESEKRILTDQFKIMERRLWYGITWPSAIVVLTMGLALLYHLPFYMKQGYFHFKLLMVLGLFAQHVYCGKILKALKDNRAIHSSTFLRYWNELTTVFLITIVFLMVMKSTLNMIIGLASLFALIFILVAAIKIYQKIRS